MYYIENLNSKIVAADSDFLQLLSVETIEELATKIAQNEINIVESDGERLKIIGENIDLSLKIKRQTIYTLFGDLELIKFKVLNETQQVETINKIVTLDMIKAPIIDENIFEESKNIDSILIDDFKSDEEDTNYSFLLNNDIDSEAQDLAKEAEAKRVAEAEAEAQRVAQEEAARAEREAEAEAQRVAQEEAARAEREAEAEAKRVAEEEAEAQRAAQEEADRLEREAEAKKVAEAQRLAQEEAARVERAAEAEAQRVAQEESDRLEREAEAKRVAEAEAQKLKEEEEDDSLDFLLDDDSFIKSESDQKEQREEEKSIKTDDDIMDFLLDDDDSFIKSDEEIEESLSQPTATLENDDTMDFLLDDGDSFMKSDEEIEESILKKDEPTEEIAEEPVLSLFEDKIEEVKTEAVTLKKADAIVIDSEVLGEELGISANDYDEFLNEFADKAVEAEDSIRDKGSDVQKKAISSLINLSQMLHLEDISTILGHIESQTGDIEDSAIETFYTVVKKLTTKAKETQEEIEEESIAEESSDEKICDLNFDDVKPIHFDFQIEKAAEDLSLPVDLIEEFVGDFIIQANEEKQTFIDACRVGDVDTIQKTGHKLKGVASNLRIVPLADTLEEVQFCEDNSRFESLLKKYWGQFLAFEAFIHTISHNQGEN